MRCALFYQSELLWTLWILLLQLLRKLFLIGNLRTRQCFNANSQPSMYSHKQWETWNSLKRLTGFNTWKKLSSNRLTVVQCSEEERPRKNIFPWPWNHPCPFLDYLFYNLLPIRSRTTDMIRYFYFVAVLLQNAITSFCKMTTMTIRNYNTARVLPYLIPAGVIMVHFSSWYVRPCVHKMACANQTNSGFRMSRSFYRLSQEIDENSEELIITDLFSWNWDESSPTVPCTT